MTITELENEINFPVRYHSICLKYPDQKNRCSKPKNQDLKKIFDELGYSVKYYSGDRIFIEKHQAGQYSFQYYFEFNGSTPLFFLYIKRAETDWPVQRHMPALGTIKKMFPHDDQDSVIGYFAFPKDSQEIKNILSEFKPLLDDLRKAVIPFLVRDELVFTLP